MHLLSPSTASSSFQTPCSRTPKVDFVFRQNIFHLHIHVSRRISDRCPRLEQPGPQRSNHPHNLQTTPKRSTKHHESTVHNFPPLRPRVPFPKPRVGLGAHVFPGPTHHLLVARQQQCDPARPSIPSRRGSSVAHNPRPRALQSPRRDIVYLHALFRRCPLSIWRQNFC